jgi:hypothetical protein
LGTVVTSILFLAAILVAVVYLTVSRRDEVSATTADRPGPCSGATGPIMETFEETEVRPCAFCWQTTR